MFDIFCDFVCRIPESAGWTAVAIAYSALIASIIFAGVKIALCNIEE